MKRKMIHQKSKRLDQKNFVEVLGPMCTSQMKMQIAKKELKAPLATSANCTFELPNGSGNVGLVEHLCLLEQLGLVEQLGLPEQLGPLEQFVLLE